MFIPWSEPEAHTLAEILSPGTEAYDRGEKLDHYKQIESLREVILVAHDRQRIEVVRRDGEAWLTLTADRCGTVRLDSVGLDLEVDVVCLDPLA